jgi:hypothetical protein
MVSWPRWPGFGRLGQAVELLVHGQNSGDRAQVSVHD